MLKRNYNKKKFALPHGAENGIFELENEEEVEALLEKLSELELSELNLSSKYVNLYAQRETIISHAYIEADIIRIALSKKGKYMDAMIEIPLDEVSIKIQIQRNDALIHFYWREDNRKSSLELTYWNNWQPLSL